MADDVAVTAVYMLPGKAVFQESVDVDPATGDAYTGSLADGTLCRLPAAAGWAVGRETTLWSPRAPAGAPR